MIRILMEKGASHTLFSGLSGPAYKRVRESYGGGAYAEGKKMLCLKSKNYNCSNIFYLEIFFQTSTGIQSIPLIQTVKAKY